MRDSPGNTYNLRSRSPKHSPETKKESFRETQDSANEEESHIVRKDDSSTKSFVEEKNESTDNTDGERTDGSQAQGTDETDGRGEKKRKQHKEKPSKKEKSMEKKNKTFESNVKVNHTCSKEGSGLSTVLQFIILMVLFLIMYSQGIINTPFSNSSKTKSTNAIIHPRRVADRLGNLSLELEYIQQKYSGSDFDESFWDLISASSWSHLQEGMIVKQPVVLMLVGQPGPSHLDTVASDIARMFSKVFTQSEESVTHIRGGEQAGKDMGQAKLDMDNILQDEFNRGGKVALISQFDMLPPCSIMLFHSYCDNYNAPYKDAVIIFTIKLQKNVPKEGSAKHNEEVVQEYLGKLWSECPEELSEDKIVAMHSRVSNNIAFVV